MSTRNDAGTPAVATVRLRPDVLEAEAHATLGSTRSRRPPAPPTVALVPMGAAAKRLRGVSALALRTLDDLDHFKSNPTCRADDEAARWYSIRIGTSCPPRPRVVAGKVRAGFEAANDVHWSITST